MAHFAKPEFLDRRRFLRLGGLSLLGGMMVFNRPLATSAMATSALETGRRLNLRNIHTDESLQCTFWSEGTYDRDALAAVDHLLRDHRTGDIHGIDPKLLDHLSALADHLQVEPVFEVISGFRSERTNRALRRQGRQVASKSFHLSGQAVDIRMPQVEVAQLHQAALALGQGGVGLYRSQNFIHIDTGPVRSW